MRVDKEDERGRRATTDEAERARRRAVMEAAQRNAAARLKPGPDAGRSQDFLQGEDGLAG